MLLYIGTPMKIIYRIHEIISCYVWQMAIQNKLKANSLELGTVSLTDKPERNTAVKITRNFVEISIIKRLSCNNYQKTNTEKQNKSSKNLMASELRIHERCSQSSYNEFTKLILRSLGLSLSVEWYQFRVFFLFYNFGGVVIWSEKCKHTSESVPPSDNVLRGLDHAKLTPGGSIQPFQRTVIRKALNLYRDGTEASGGQEDLDPVVNDSCQSWVISGVVKRYSMRRGQNS